MCVFFLFAKNRIKTRLTSNEMNEDATCIQRNWNGKLFTTIELYLRILFIKLKAFNSLFSCFGTRLYKYCVRNGCWLWSCRLKHCLPNSSQMNWCNGILWYCICSLPLFRLHTFCSWRCHRSVLLCHCKIPNVYWHSQFMRNLHSSKIEFFFY